MVTARASALTALLWPMMSGARQPSPWLKPYKIASNRRVRKLCRRPSNCEHFATRLRFTVSTPPIQADTDATMHAGLLRSMSTLNQSPLRRAKLQARSRPRLLEPLSLAPPAPSRSQSPQLNRTASPTPATLATSASAQAGEAVYQSS